MAVRQIQLERYKKAMAEGKISSSAIPRTNAEADGELLEYVASPDAVGRALLTQAADQMKLSARGYHRVLRVARTLADMMGSDTVTRTHIAEALGYRRLNVGR